MPRSVTVLQVMSRPRGDLSEERDVVAEAIEELNLSWRKSGAVQLNLIRRETDARPGLAEDPQALINRQIA